MGGVHFSPPNNEVQSALRNLLTEPLAKLLRNEDPGELLLALNENVEKCNKIWNLSMRQELLEFVRRINNQRTPGFVENDLNVASNFYFTRTRDEIMLGGIYVRVFVKTAEIAEIENPSLLCKELLYFLNSCLMDSSDDNSLVFENENSSFPVIVVEALNILACSRQYIIDDIIDFEDGIITLFRLLDVRLKPEVLDPLCQLLKRLCTSSEFVKAATSKNGCTWRLIRYLCLCSGSSSTDAWNAAEGFISTVEGLEAFIESHGIVYMIGIIFGSLGYCHAYTNRVRAVGIISKLMWNPLKGSTAAAILRRFIPEPLVRLLKSKALDATLKVLDTISETPELIWTHDMKDELRTAVNTLLSHEGDAHYGFGRPIILAPDFAVVYKNLRGELYVGEVYIRLYLKQRTFRLTNPVHFLEQLVVVWENSFNNQVPLSRDNILNPSTNSTDLVLGNEDFLSLLTSSIICVLSTEADTLDHLISWGLDHRLFEFLQRAIDTSRRGVPMVCILRLLKWIVGSSSALTHLCANMDCKVVLNLLRESMRNDLNSANKLQYDAVIAAEVMKIIFHTASFPIIDILVREAINVQIPEFILDDVLSSNIEYVRNPNNLRIYCVDTLKAMYEASGSTPHLQDLLNGHKAWRRYRTQSHDLFLVVTSSVQHSTFIDLCRGMIKQIPI